MSDHNTNTYIREEVTKVFRKQMRPQQTFQDMAVPMPIPNPIPPAERSKFMSHFLVTCILLVSVATIFGLLSKTIDWQNWRNTTIVERVVQKQKTEKYITVSEVEKLVSEIDLRMSKMESSLKTWSRRVWLLGIVNNENATMNSYMNRKYHPNEPSDYLSFEKDWKLNRMPRSIDLQGEDKEKLKEMVK